MKRKVLSFYGILFAFVIVLMMIQISKYGSITGNLNYENPGGVVNGNEISVFEPLKILIYSGSGKTEFLKVANSRAGKLENCFIKGEEDFGSWIVSEYSMNFDESESGMYQFNVVAPENTNSGQYEIPYIFICGEYRKKGVLEVEVLDDENAPGSSKFTSVLTGFSSADTKPTKSSLAIFVLIGILVIGLVGLYIKKKNRKIESLSRIHGNGRRLIKLELGN